MKLGLALVLRTSECPKSVAQKLLCDWLLSRGCVNGHFRNLNWRYLPYGKGYFLGLNFREYPHKIWSYMVQYLHFRILKFPLNVGLK